MKSLMISRMRPKPIRKKSAAGAIATASSQARRPTARPAPANGPVMLLRRGIDLSDFTRLRRRCNRREATDSAAIAPVRSARRILVGGRHLLLLDAAVLRGGRGGLLDHR